VRGRRGRGEEEGDLDKDVLIEQRQGRGERRGGGGDGEEEGLQQQEEEEGGGRRRRRKAWHEACGEVSL